MSIDDYNSYDRKILTFDGEYITDLTGNFTLRELLDMNASMDDGSYVFDADLLSNDYGTIVEENTIGLVYEYICHGF